MDNDIENILLFLIHNQIKAHILQLFMLFRDIIIIYFISWQHSLQQAGTV